jgi:hypothetical protein
MDCFLTHTTAATHALIEANLAETPVYGGWVDAKGPRYCPSIEDKIVRFRDKDSHQVGCLLLAVCDKASCSCADLEHGPRAGCKSSKLPVL